MNADNQQERLIKIGWIIGFVDGEGCFSIGIIKQPDRINRRGYTTGFQVSHDFVVTQGAKSHHALEEIQNFFGVGKIYLNKRSDNHKEHLYQYMVHRRDHLLDVIIPFFRKHSLRTDKKNDFEKFAQCVKYMAKNVHLSNEGLIKILEIIQTMNRKKSREDLIRILRGHTPNSLF